MSRFIYPENPQVTYWREKCEALQATLEQERKGDKSYLLEMFEKKIAVLSELLDDERQEKEELKQKLIELREDIEVFNSLPWYEKIFHKFD